MEGITHLGHWWWILVLPWIWLLKNGGTKGRWVGVWLILVAILSDSIPGLMLKPLFGRPRPFMEIEAVNVLLFSNHPISSYGFPSNHATNMFALSTFIFLSYPKKWVLGTFLTISLAVAFSRVYVGVHYPMDVLAGALLGMSIGWFVFWLSNRFKKRVPSLN